MACMALYILTAKPHSGKMSSSTKSDAVYFGIINRGKSDIGEVCLLLQFIPPNAGTSYHYHDKVTESFYPLLGQCFLITSAISPEKTSKMTLDKTAVTRLSPRTAHRLTTQESSAVNVLCMDPYDAELKDHHYT